MTPFTYCRPSSLSEATEALSRSVDAKLLAGGHTLIPTIKQRLANPAVLIDLHGLHELHGIEREAGGIRIGSMTTHAEVAANDAVRSTIPALAQLAARIGDPQVRHCGTIGGSLANNDPAADYPAAVLALNAMVLTSKRRIAADDFFKGLFTTALSGDEIITAILFPIADKAAYQKFDQRASRFALAGVFVARNAARVRVAVTGCGQAGVFRLTAMEQALERDFSSRAIKAVDVAENDLIADMHGSARYRANLIKVLAARAVDSA